MPTSLPLEYFIQGWFLACPNLNQSARIAKETFRIASSGILFPVGGDNALLNLFDSFSSEFKSTDFLVPLLRATRTQFTAVKLIGRFFSLFSFISSID